MRAKKGIFIVVMFLMVIIFVDCGQSTEEKIFNHLEEAVLLEEEFEKQQEPISDLEKQEQEIYEKIINLDMEKFSEIKKLSDQAIEMIDERKELLDIEKDSMEASKEELLKVESLFDQLEEKSAKDMASDLYDTMLIRYDEYTTLHDLYKSTLTLEEELRSEEHTSELQSRFEF